MMDANDVLASHGDMAEWLSDLNLYDLHTNHPAPSTYIGSSQRRIDFIFGCSHIHDYVEASGTLSYIEGPQSDHRGLYVDLDLARYLHHDATKSSHLPAHARTLKTGNPEMVVKYHQEMLKYYKNHKMEERIETLYKNFRTLHPDILKQQLESWDRDQGRAMKSAEKTLQIPKSQYAWSPALRNVAIIKR